MEAWDPHVPTCRCTVFAESLPKCKVVDVGHSPFTKHLSLVPLRLLLQHPPMLAGSDPATVWRQRGKLPLCPLLRFERQCRWERIREYCYCYCGLTWVRLVDLWRPVAPRVKWEWEGCPVAGPRSDKRTLQALRQTRGSLRTFDWYANCIPVKLRAKRMQSSNRSSP